MDVGTVPSAFFAKRLISAPLRPVISAAGMRVVVVMTSSS